MHINVCVYVHTYIHTIPTTQGKYDTKHFCNSKHVLHFNFPLSLSLTLFLLSVFYSFRNARC